MVNHMETTLDLNIEYKRRLQIGSSSFADRTDTEFYALSTLHMLVALYTTEMFISSVEIFTFIWYLFVDRGVCIYVEERFSTREVVCNA